jgi:uncharacterized protein GlcG (DUF336 family)
MQNRQLDPTTAGRGRAQSVRSALSSVTAASGLLAVLLTTPGSSGAQGLPTEKYLPASLAVEAATAAVDACQKQGYRASAAVVDRAGVVRVVLRGDGAGPHTVDGSIRKAYTAASFRMPTSFLVEFVNSTPAAAGLRHADRVLLFGGGLPIEAGGELVGAIAVGGAPGGLLDDACAQAGLDKIKDRLK